MIPQNAESIRKKVWEIGKEPIDDKLLYFEYVRRHHVNFCGECWESLLREAERIPSADTISRRTRELKEELKRPKLF